MKQGPFSKRISLAREFDTMARIEPALSELELRIKDHARTNAKTKLYCANENWYGQNNFRAAVIRLVGWEASNPILRTMHAYDVAYEHLYNLLPDCRHESMCGG